MVISDLKGVSWLGNKFQTSGTLPRKVGIDRHRASTSASRCDTPLSSSFIQSEVVPQTATAGSDVVQSGRPIFDDFFQHLWPYIGNNTANVVFQMVKRLWLIRIEQ
ncbi:hypothetical protein TNCV_2157971 [Trichonephila clavipes]|nr:hypothetical protein TNCV_2157971 [Trichonephila clavipes]